MHILLIALILAAMAGIVILLTRTRMSNPVIPLKLPLPISPVGIQLWLAADAIEEPDGTFLTSWGDLSFNASSVRQDTPSSRPQFKLAQLNGLPVVVFDQVNDYLSIGGRNGLYFEKNSPLSIFFVAKFGATAPPVIPIGKLDQNGLLGGWYYTVVTNATPDVIGFNLRGSQSQFVRKLSTIGDGIIENWHALGVVYTGSVSSLGITLYQDGLPITTNLQTLDQIVDTTKVPYSPKVGSLDGGEDGGGGWSLAEMIVFSRALLPAEITLLEQYFRQKWGVP